MAVYAILLTISIALYALIDLSGINESLASELLSWSATIFAPIAVLCGLNSWKLQNKQIEKIETLKKLKDIAVEFYILIDQFRSTSNAYFKIQNGHIKELDKLSKSFIDDYAALTRKFFYEMNKRDEYFNDVELDQLTTKLNALLGTANAFTRAGLVLETALLSIPRNGVLSGEKLELEKNLYLMDPHSLALKFVLNDDESKLILEEFAKDKIFKHIQSLTDYVSAMIKQSYKL